MFIIIPIALCLMRNMLTKKKKHRRLNILCNKIIAITESTEEIYNIIRVVHRVNQLIYFFRRKKFRIWNGSFSNIEALKSNIKLCRLKSGVQFHSCII
jgi:hypothetical protein